MGKTPCKTTFREFQDLLLRENKALIRAVPWGSEFFFAKAILVDSGDELPGCCRGVSWVNLPWCFHYILHIRFIVSLFHCFVITSLSV